MIEQFRHFGETVIGALRKAEAWSKEKNEPIYVHRAYGLKQVYYCVSNMIECAEDYELYYVVLPNGSVWVNPVEML